MASAEQDYPQESEQVATLPMQLEAAYPAQAEYPGDYGEAGHDDGYDYAAEQDAYANDDREWGLTRRNTTKIVIAVLVLAVCGGAAFGYRTIFKNTTQGPPPLIHADSSPTRMVPAASGEANGKAINERLGGAGLERLARREEDPVELREAPRSGNAIVPGVPFAGVAPAPSAGAPASAAAAPGSSSSLTEPKRVRTVTIRADQGGMPGSPPPAPRAGRPTAAPAATGPLGVVPQAMADASPAPRTASPQSPAPEGGFVVQLSAQKSEAEAQSTLHAMQSRYSVLNGQRTLVRRKDQGDRGVFYAAQVGPFTSKNEADQLCDSLKTAGGTCFVQRN